MELSYISGKGNPKNLLIFQEVTFLARKMKKTHFEKTSYISGGNLQCLKIKKFLYFFSNKAQRKVSYTFPYKEAKLSKLK